MQEVLRGKDDLPIHSSRQYDLSDLYPSLKGVLLSRRGFTIHYTGPQSECQFSICVTCHKTLTNSRTNNLPKFAIANGFATGHLPDEF